MTLITVIIFLIVLAVLIFAHELGHFLAARACGVRVDSFKIGFGPKIVAWHFKGKDGKPCETEYGINWIPFGGYVKIFGENPDEKNLDARGVDASRSFALKPRWKQAIVLAAGVFFNFLFAWLLYTIVFTSGVAVSTGSFPQYASRFQNQRIMITDVLPGSPAEKAGLQAGDVVTGIIDRYPAGSPLNEAFPIMSDPDFGISLLQTAINQGGIDLKAAQNVNKAGSMAQAAPLTISYSRGPQSKAASIIPIQGLNPDDKAKYAIGIALNDAADLRLPVWSAAWAGLEYTSELIKETVVGLYAFIANIFVGHPDFSQVAGPIGIAGIVGNAAEMGLTYLLMVTAIISLNLGVINLIPFPALDGGRILFVAIEGIIRRRISPRFTNSVNAVSFALLMILMVIVTYKDIAKLVK